MSKTSVAGSLDYCPDVLPLLAAKVGPRQLDINYRFSYISIRDQIVRAQMAVKALVDTGLVDKDSRRRKGQEFDLAIFGAGIAGVAAALQAEREGLRFILIEKDSFPGGILKSKANRYVSTSMYEWPNTTYGSHKFPLRTPELLGLNIEEWSLQLEFSKPVRIEEFSDRFVAAVQARVNVWRKNATGREIGSWLVEGAAMTEATKRTLLDLLSQNNGSMLASDIKEGEPVRIVYEQAPYPATTTVWSKYLIYAVGYGKEQESLASDGSTKKLEFTHFWAEDRVDKEYLGFRSSIRLVAPPNVLVIGSGDGALQDALRCLVKCEEAAHPLAIWEALIGQKRDPADILNVCDEPELQEAMRELLSYDVYSTGGATWGGSPESFAQLDAAFDKIAQRLVSLLGDRLAANLQLIVRPDVDSVTIARREPHFSKAYALNRFLILLIRRLLDELPPTVVRPSLHFVDGDVADVKVSKDKRGGTVSLESKGTLGAFRLIIQRGGIDRSGDQRIALESADAGRIELGRIPPPVVAVAPAVREAEKTISAPAALTASVA
ncbi:FAD-dependent oxidoreductase [Paraburkholderia sp. 22B1P]|uniref:FAD-dependent oxidoreductase n=1 Tax=Paraburkholderia sp. 22B1P TaxID=3080498 RepID=UPI003089D1C7|nr:FAD-dependent oxidoreductase [Paraburkholderia sp. 22B1P]